MIFWPNIGLKVNMHLKVEPQNGKKHIELRHFWNCTNS